MALTDQSVSISDPRLVSEERLAIVLGTEGVGLNADTIEECDYTVKIAHGSRCGLSLMCRSQRAVAFWQLAGKS